MPNPNKQPSPSRLRLGLLGVIATTVILIASINDDQSLPTTLCPQLDQNGQTISQVITGYSTCLSTTLPTTTAPGQALETGAGQYQPTPEPFVPSGKPVNNVNCEEVTSAQVPGQQATACRVLSPAKP
jgi:hypothetical protein